MWLANLGRVLLYGRSSAQRISKTNPTIGSWQHIYMDILRSFVGYYVTNAQYEQKKLYQFSGNDKKQQLRLLGKANRQLDKWNKLYYSNWKFLGKWTQEKYSGSPHIWPIGERVPIKNITN